MIVRPTQVDLRGNLHCAECLALQNITFSQGRKLTAITHPTANTLAWVANGDYCSREGSSITRPYSMTYSDKEDGIPFIQIAQYPTCDNCDKIMSITSLDHTKMRLRFQHAYRHHATNAGIECSYVLTKVAAEYIVFI